MSDIHDLYDELYTLGAKVEDKINDEHKRSLLNLIASAQKLQNEISDLAIESGISEEFMVEYMIKVIQGNFYEEEFFNAKELKW